MNSDYIIPGQANVRPKIGLALGSGLVRGWAHIGAIRALVRNGFKPDIIAGTSVGALAGAAYVNNRLDELEDWARSLNRSSVMHWVDPQMGKGGGLIAGLKLYKLMREHFGDTKIENMKVNFAAVAADMVTGHEVWLREGDLVQAMRASFALPGVFPPMMHNGRLLVDGALVNPVPVSACQAMGADMIIAINLNGDIVGKLRKGSNNFPTVAGFDPLNPDSSPDTAEQASLSKRAKRLFGRDTQSPSLFGVLISAMNIIQDRLARSRLAGEPPDVLITPRIGHIGLMEFERVDELINLGEQAVENMLPQLRDAWQVLCVDSFRRRTNSDTEGAR
jgi:NTE family protein